MGYPSIFPTGTLIYDKEKTFNGYTIFPSAKGALLIDMNGREVQLWAGLGGFPNKILPGGYVMGTTGKKRIRTRLIWFRLTGMEILSGNLIKQN
jgi:hypothetical protein